MHLKDSYQTFIRLLGFARPYWPRLAVGLLAGLLTGGSLFGLLRFSPYLIVPFEQSAAPRAGGPPANSASSGASRPTTRNERSLPGFRQIERIAAVLHIPLTEAGGARISWQLMLLAALGVPLFQLLKSAAVYINRYYMRWVGARVVMDIRNTLFAHLARQSLAFFGRRDVGDLISHCTNDTMLVDSAISGTIADLSRAPFEIGASVLFVVLFAREQHMLGMVLISLVLFPLGLAPLTFLGRIVRRFTRRSLEKISGVVSRMQETFTGIEVVQAYNTAGREIDRFTALNQRYFKNVIRALRANLLMTPLMEFVGALAACAFVVLCYIHHVRMSEIGPIAYAAMTAYRPLKKLARIQASLQQALAGADRIFAILDTDTSLPAAEHPVQLTGFHRQIQFEHVSFRYDAGGPWTLLDLNFVIPKGTVAAFVGETGVGKSTVAGLLARFFDPTEGTVSIDGHDLRQVDLASLRALLGVVGQNAILFNDTIAANIAYGAPEAARDEIVKAAKMANAHDFIMAHPEGYDRVVGEKGMRLSGGERQRIAIARAILRNPPILILDEATSALDTVTEKLVQEAINRVMEHRTVLAIAHRLSTIQHADQIFVLEAGRIVEHGTHRELLATGGRYRKLCDMQFSG